MAAAAEETPTKSRATPSEASQHDNTNGNGSVFQSDPLTASTAAASKENIFLFWPNIIGMIAPHRKMFT